MTNLSEESKKNLATSIKNSYGGGLAGFSLFDGVVTTREDDSVAEGVAKENTKDVVNTHVSQHTGHVGLTIQALPAQQGFDTGTWIMAPIECVSVSESKIGLVFFNQFGATTAGNQGRACFVAEFGPNFGIVGATFDVANGPCIDIMDSDIIETTHGDRSQYRIISSKIIPNAGFAGFTDQPTCSLELTSPNTSLDTDLEKSLGSLTTTAIYSFGNTATDTSRMLAVNDQGKIMWGDSNSFDQELTTFKPFEFGGTRNGVIALEGSGDSIPNASRIVADTCITNDVFYSASDGKKLLGSDSFTALIGCTPTSS